LIIDGNPTSREIGWGVENCLKFFSRGAAFMDFEPASGTKNGDTPLPHTSESRVPRVVCKNALQNLHVKELGYQNLENKEFSRGWLGALGTCIRCGVC
jgi:hypothetical protein